MSEYLISGKPFTITDNGIEYSCEIWTEKGGSWYLNTYTKLSCDRIHKRKFWIFKYTVRENIFSINLGEIYESGYAIPVDNEWYYDPEKIKNQILTWIQIKKRDKEKELKQKKHKEKIKIIDKL
jgi:hypothetical protein